MIFLQLDILEVLVLVSGKGLISLTPIEVMLNALNIDLDNPSPDHYDFKSKFDLSKS
jgi:hypothetical protein